MEPIIDSSRIRNLRKQRGWSQQDLALESGLSRSTVSKIETGSYSNPRIGTLIPLAQAFHVLVDELLLYPAKSAAEQAMDRIINMIQKGLTILMQKMDEDPGYDFNRGYEAKNAYFNKCERIGRPLWARVPVFTLGNGSYLVANFYGVAELYHKILLACIRDYETHRNKRFNKGMVCGNLGVAQLAAGKIDEGVSSLLEADLEDQDFINHDPHHIFDKPLWEQFERPYIFPYIQSVTRGPCASMRIPVDEDFLQSFMTSLQLQDRLLLETSIWAASENLQRARASNTIHFRSRLLAALRDICWLIEWLLRSSPIGVGYLATQQQKHHVSLHSLICNAVRGKRASYPAGYKSSVGTEDEFVPYTQAILGAKGKCQARSLHCLVLTRNYTHHYFDPIPTRHDWFPLYEDVLGTVLAAMFYLRSINAL